MLHILIKIANSVSFKKFIVAFEKYVMGKFLWSHVTEKYLYNPTM